MYPNNNELVKMGTFVIITKIIHRYSDYSTAEESGLCGTCIGIFDSIGGSTLDLKVHILMLNPLYDRLDVRVLVQQRPGKGQNILAMEEAGI